MRVSVDSWTAKWTHDAVFTSFFGTPTAELRCCLDAAFLVVGEAICLDMSPTKKGSKSLVKAADAQKVKKSSAEVYESKSGGIVDTLNSGAIQGLHRRDAPHAC